MHGGVHPREVRTPYWPRVARDGVRKSAILVYEILVLVLVLLPVLLLVLPPSP